MSSERGSASVLVVGSMAVILVVGMMVIEAAGLVTARVRAQTAADASALAAAVATSTADDPRSEAARYAEANGATLVTCRCRADSSPGPRVARVVVETVHETGLFGRVTVRAGASAEFDPAGPVGS